MCDVMKKKANKEAAAQGLIEEDEEMDFFPDSASVEFSLGDTSFDTSLGTSMGSEFEDIPKEVRSDIQDRIAADIRMALEDSALPAPRASTVSLDSSKAPSIRSVKVPPGKIGVVVDASEDGPVIQEVYQSSPLKGRINPGDRILGINGTPVEGLSQESLAILMASQADKEREFEIESFL